MSFFYEDKIISLSILFFQGFSYKGLRGFHVLAYITTSDGC